LEYEEDQESFWVCAHLFIYRLYALARTNSLDQN